MDPKLRPSFPEIVKRLEDIQRCLKAEESERDRLHLPTEIEKKTIPKGVYGAEDRTDTMKDSKSTTKTSCFI